MTGACFSLTRYGRLLTVAGLIGALVSRAQTQDEVVKMSPYEVTASSAQFKQWSKVSSPHFVVYSDASAVEMIAVVREMEMMHLAAQKFFGRVALNRPPVIVVLPTSGSDWRKLEAKGGVEWEVAVSSPADILLHLVVAQYSWQTDGLDLVWGTMGAVETEWLSLPTPLWFQEGVMNFFETAVFTSDSISLGYGNDRVRTTVRQGWLPWQRVFAAGNDSPEFTKDKLHDRFSGQCSAFVQYMLANRDAVWVERLMTWVSLTDAGTEPTESEFKAVFGQDWKTWQANLEKYLSDGTFKVAKMPFSPEMMKLDILQVDAGPREMRELFILTQILNQDVPASEASLDALLAKGLQTPALRELLAEACHDKERDEALRDQLQQLIRTNTTNPNVYALQAQQLFDEKVPDVSPSSRLGAEHAQIESLCRRALVLEPRHPDANDTLALTLAIAPEVSSATVTAIMEIYRTLSGNASTCKVVVALALAQWRSGDSAGARETCRIIAESKFADEDARTFAATLVKQLGSAP